MVIITFLMMLVLLFLTVSPFIIVIVLLKRLLRRGKRIRKGKAPPQEIEELKKDIEELKELVLVLASDKPAIGNIPDCDNCRHKVNLEKILLGGKY